MAFYSEKILSPIRDLLSTIDHSRRTDYCSMFKILSVPVVKKHLSSCLSYSKEMYSIIVYCSHQKCVSYSELEFFFKWNVDNKIISAQTLNMCRPMHYIIDSEDPSRPNFNDYEDILHSLYANRDCQFFSLVTDESGKYVVDRVTKKPATSYCAHDVCSKQAISMYTALELCQIGAINTDNVLEILENSWSKRLTQAQAQGKDIINVLFDQKMWPGHLPFMWLPTQSLLMTDTDVNPVFIDQFANDGYRV